MSRTRYLGMFLSSATLVAMSLTLGGCKAQQQMQQTIAAQDERIQALERRIKDIDADVRAQRMVVNELKNTVKLTGDTVVAMENAERERERERKAEEEKSKAAAAAKAKPGKKPLPKKKHK